MHKSLANFTAKYFVSFVTAKPFRVPKHCRKPTGLRSGQSAAKAEGYRRSFGHLRTWSEATARLCEGFSWSRAAQMEYVETMGNTPCLRASKVSVLLRLLTLRLLTEGVGVCGAEGACGAKHGGRGDTVARRSDVFLWPLRAEKIFIFPLVTLMGNMLYSRV